MKMIALRVPTKVTCIIWQIDTTPTLKIAPNIEVFVCSLQGTFEGYLKVPSRLRAWDGTWVQPLVNTSWWSQFVILWKSPWLTLLEKSVSWDTHCLKVVTMSFDACPQSTHSEGNLSDSPGHHTNPPDCANVLRSLQPWGEVLRGRIHTNPFIQHVM